MSTFTQQQLEQLNELMRQYVTPLQRTPQNVINGRSIYGYNTNGSPIFNPNDPNLPPVPTTRFTGNTNQLQGDAADLADSARYERILGIYGNAQNNAQQQFNETGQVLQGLRGNLSRGFDAAQGELRTAGQSARRDIQGAQTRAIAQNAQSARSRGLTNTTVLDNMNRGTRSDTQRNLAGLYENLGGMRSGLAERRAGAEFAGGQALTNFMRDRTGAETDLMLQGANPIQRRSDLYAALQMARLQAAQGRSGGGGAGEIIGGLLGGLGRLI